MEKKYGPITMTMEEVEQRLRQLSFEHRVNRDIVKARVYDFWGDCRKYVHGGIHMDDKKRALITGITGQDGSYLAELLLRENYDIHGIIRRASTPNISRIEHLLDQITLHVSDLTDQASLTRVVGQVQPKEVYNLAAQSFVHSSWDVPAATADVTAVGVTKMLEAVRAVDRHIRFYQASSSEMFGKVVSSPQNEETPFRPRSPYGVAKVYGHYITVNYRESYDMFCVSGILFNHESPRRGLEFVTRKITDGVAKIKFGHQKFLHLGNLEAKRDWGHAWDYVRAMWLMLQQDEPNDYVVGTGVCHSILDFVKAAFEHAGLDYREHVRVDPKFCRPADVEVLRADPARAKDKLGWEPEVSFEELVSEMMDADLGRWDRPAEVKHQT